MLESELFVLLEGTTDAAFSVTEEGEILSWNKAAEKLFGYPRTAAVHKTCYEILEGMGPLGTRVCHRALQRGRVRRWQHRDSQLRHERQDTLRKARVDQHVYDCVR